MPRSSLLDRLGAAPQLLLCIAVLGWSGNFIVGRLVGDTVPPIQLAFLRWLLAALLLLPFGLAHLRRDAPTLRRHAPLIVALAVTGVVVFNTLVYIGLGSTPAVTGLLLQSVGPLFILAFTALLFRERPRVGQVVGILVSLVGVWVIVSRGQVFSAGVAVGGGEWWFLAAVLSYSLYTALLRLAPKVHPLSILLATFGIGTAILAPMAAVEFASGQRVPATAGAFWAVLYVGIVPSIVSYFCWNRGVGLMGAARAGQYLHLLPVFGAALAFIVLGEALAPFHLVGAAIIATGILLAGRSRPAMPR
ncbi:MAG: DMT family transporter [Mobilicoccus sp.]|nr:DMT family transporter [Mobilicoccus sp.]